MRRHYWLSLWLILLIYVAAMVSLIVWGMLNGTN